MDLDNPPAPDPTAHSRRKFMQRTGGVSLAAMVGFSSGAAAQINDDEEFETNPYSLGVASGDPLPNSVIIWTRLAPSPLESGGGMPPEAFDVDWTVATDEGMDGVITSGTATAEPEHAHTVHVDAAGLEPNTEYYYQFESRGVESPVGRTKTAPEPGTAIDEFRFGFASCQSWSDGYYTPHRYMAKDQLDLIVHLGDYIYEYGINGAATPRSRALPQDYRKETTNLDLYRLRYSLYKSDPDLQAAHASAPWLITRDDHEVDNNWAGDVPQDPDEQSTEAFIERRAAAFKAYYEHMPFRTAQKPDDANQKLYRYYSFGDLVDFNVLDTRLYRDDQACGDVFDEVGCEERLEEGRTILGDAQEEWLLGNLDNSETTWNVVANQLPFAKMDFKRGEQEGYRTEQWDGYVPEQNTVKRAFEEDANNPVVVTGDFHSNWANDIITAEEGSSEPVGTEFVGTSISSNGDGSELDDFNGDEEGVLGRHVIEENENVKYNCNRRGYTRCTLTSDTWTTEFQVVDYVSRPGAPLRNDATFTVEAGQPGIQPKNATVVVNPATVASGLTDTTDLLARWLPNGLAGGLVTVSIDDPDVASIAEVTAADSFVLTDTSVSDDGSSATIEFVDTDQSAQSVVGGVDITLATLDIEGLDTGTTEFDISVNQLNDNDGNDLKTDTRVGTVSVGEIGDDQ